MRLSYYLIEKEFNADLLSLFDFGGWWKRTPAWIAGGAKNENGPRPSTI
jgi:hypothetical protein